MNNKMLRIFQAVILVVLTFFIALEADRLSKGIITGGSGDEVADATEFGTEQTADVLRVDSPKELVFTVNDPLITFYGFCDRSLILTINNDEVAKNEDGSFSHNIELNLGENKITVSDTVTVLEYCVTYTPSMIKSVSPSGTITEKGDKQVSIKAVAAKGAAVVANIGGVTIDLKADENAKVIEKTGDIEFVTYSGVFTTPKAKYSKQDLGKIKVTAAKDSERATAYGAKIIVEALKLQDVIIPTDKNDVSEPQISGDGKVKLLSPFEDHGFGQANICTVSKDYAETLSASINDGEEDPRQTPLLSGTVDYVVGSAVFDKRDFLLLKSGKKIKAEDQSTKLGYIMPPNALSVHKSYTDKNTNIILTTNWKIPFNAELKNQSYYKGYAGMIFNCVDSTSQYIDFVFSYTVAVSGELDVSGSNVIKSAEWVNVGDNASSTLRVHLKNKGKFYGYKTYYSNDNRLVISFKNKPSSAKNSTVMILPGHGGRDPGAIAVNGVYESQINLVISSKVKNYLESQGVNVKLMRTGDTYTNLDNYISSVRTSKADAFISIHSNSSTSKSKSGVESYYYRNYSKPLADKLQSRVVDVWKEIYSGNNDMIGRVNGDVRYYPFRAIRVEECPAMLIECGYLSNALECEKLCDPVNQDKIAIAIGQGIIDYLNS